MRAGKPAPRIMTEGIARFVRHEGCWEFYLPHPPVPAARPRVSRWGTYYPTTYRNWRLDTDASLVRFDRPVTPVLGPVYVTMYSVCKRPKKLTRVWPRGDVDNFSKAVLDAVTRSKLVWKDDDQVQILNVGKRYAEEEEEPHTYIMVAQDSWALLAVGLNDPHLVGDDVYDLPSEARETLVNG